MSLDQLFQTLEHRLFHLSRKIWPPDPALAWRDEVDRIQERLRRGTEALQRTQEEARGFREAVFKEEVRATILGSQIESWVFTGNQDKAWRQALELDRIREGLQESRKRLKELENQCQRLAKGLQQMESRLILLQLKLAESAKRFSIEDF